jgi:hypothetical protein
MATECTRIIGRNICGFLDYCDLTCQEAGCDSYLWYSLERVLNPENGGKLPELRQIPQEPKRQHVSATQQKESEIRQ